ncbi:MAG: cytochrome C, partial [Deltaproteobacteria bacterium]|nr:cytochrome C [Deltaproteobacteria bacterium]
KHRKISPDVCNRDTIGSRSNCSACHSTAEKGIYEDDFIAIPD